MPELDVLLEGRSIWTCHVAELAFHIIYCNENFSENLGPIQTWYQYGVQKHCSDTVVPYTH